jgi:hypothetical protein
MPVSGLLLTIDPAHEPALRQALSADARTTPGDLVKTRLVVALDTPSRRADEAAWAWLRALPGVSWIDLVWISIDPAEDDPPHQAGLP